MAASVVSSVANESAASGPTRAYNAAISEHLSIVSKTNVKVKQLPVHHGIVLALGDDKLWLYYSRGRTGSVLVCHQVFRRGAGGGDHLHMHAARVNEVSTRHRGLQYTKNNLRTE